MNGTSLNDKKVSQRINELLPKTQDDANDLLPTKNQEAAQSPTEFA